MAIVPNQKLTRHEYEMIAAFRYALRRFLRFSEEAAALAGLTPQQHQALLAIKGFPGENFVTMGELKERLQLRPHSVVGLINRLASRGWVTRRPSTSDRRRVHIQLTHQGTTLIERVTAINRERLRQIGPELTEALTALSESTATKSGQ